MQHATTKAAVAALTLALGGVTVATPQIDWHTIDGGGGTLQSASYTLSGTVGQPDAGVQMNASTTLHGGFWVRASNSCGAADCDDNGVLNIDDIDCYVTGFLGGSLAVADCDANGVLNIDDIDCFVSDFLAGCP